MGINPGMLSSKKETWATPVSFFDECNREFKFNIDDPPYGKEIGKWMKKAYEE